MESVRGRRRPCSSKRPISSRVNPPPSQEKPGLDLPAAGNLTSCFTCLLRDGPMKISDTVTRAETSLTRDILYALRYWLRGRRGPIALTGVAAVAVAALNWNWLVAVGVAPILLAVLPCAAMCALGVCMNKAGGKSCSTRQDTPGDTASFETLRSRTRPSVASAGQTSSSPGDPDSPLNGPPLLSKRSPGNPIRRRRRKTSANGPE